MRFCGLNLLPLLPFLLLLCLGSQARAEVVLGAKQFVMLHPGLDTIWGTYYFGIRNLASDPEQFSAPIMLPKETIDFQAHQGIEQSEMVPKDDGLIWFDKEFKSGLSIVSMGFKAAAASGEATLTYKFLQEMENFTILTKPGQLQLESDKMKKGEAPEMVGGDFEALVLENARPGDIVEIKISGIPAGRGMLWLIGSVFAAALAIAAVLGALFSRPKLNESDVSVSI